MIAPLEKLAAAAQRRAAAEAAMLAAMANGTAFEQVCVHFTEFQMANSAHNAACGEAMTAVLAGNAGRHGEPRG